MSTAVFAVCELFYFAAPLLVRNAEYLNTSSSDQRSTLMLLSMKVYGLGAGIFTVFYGVASRLRGYLCAGAFDERHAHTTGIATCGGATLDIEENYLIKKLFTAGLGMVCLSNQARI